MRTARKLNEAIIAQNIDRHPVGKRLTPEARAEAVRFGVDAWKGSMGNGQAADIGIQHVTSGVFKDKA